MSSCLIHHILLIGTVNRIFIRIADSSWGVWFCCASTAITGECDLIFNTPAVESNKAVKASIWSSWGDLVIVVPHMPLAESMRLISAHLPQYLRKKLNLLCRSTSQHIYRIEIIVRTQAEFPIISSTEKHRACRGAKSGNIISLKSYAASPHFIQDRGSRS